MKRIISTILMVIMLLGTSTVAFAEGTTTSPQPNLTSEQQQARDQFLSVYLDKMTKLADLRAQTKAAEDANNTIASQIKVKEKASTASQQNQDAIDKIKTVAQQNKDLVTQAKTLNTQRVTLRKQFDEAVKNRDTNTAASLKDQILSITNQIEGLRAQAKANMDSVQALKDQVKAYRDTVKAKQDKIKPLFQQAKDIHQKIVNEEKAKNALWGTYKQNIQAKDYTAAGNTLQSILDAKTQIIADIKARGDILNQILSNLNS